MDIDGIKNELQTFVEQAAPRNGSSAGFVTTTSRPRCGRKQAIALSERVRPILDRLYPDWRADNSADPSFEFRSEYDAAQRLLARLGSRAQIEAMLGAPSPAPQLDAGQLHALVWGAASVQWSTGHLHEAILAAAKAVNSLLQKKLDRRDVSEVKLVREAFTSKPPTADAPRLRFADVEDDQTRDSMREGAMNFGVGCFQAIRNPVGHLLNDEHELSDQQALERLAAWSLFARWIEEAQLEVAMPT